MCVSNSKKQTRHRYVSATARAMFHKWSVAQSLQKLLLRRERKQDQVVPLYVPKRLLGQAHVQAEQSPGDVIGWVGGWVGVCVFVCVCVRVCVRVCVGGWVFVCV